MLDKERKRTRLDPVLRVVRKVIGFFGPPLICLALASVVMMLLSNPDPFARDWLCGAGVCFYSDAAFGWNSFTYDVAAGSFTAIVFFWLLVRWPEHRRRQRIKNSFRVQYRAFKLSCIEIFMVVVGDGGINEESPESLLPIDKFREYFKQPVGPYKNRWHEVANNMTPYYLEAILARMEFLRQEISLVMHTTDIDDENAVTFLKGLSKAIWICRSSTVEYDSIKSFVGFFWDLFAGWDWVDGYRARDIVEDMLDTI